MLKRESPVDMGLEPERVVIRDGWEIALSYVGEMRRNDCYVTDLSHVPKWTVQGADLDSRKPAGLSMPGKPRMAVVSEGSLLARLTPTEARLFAFGKERPTPSDPFATDVTDGYAALGVVGPKCYAVLSKLSNVDLARDPVPSVALAPLEDVTCFIAQLEGQGKIPGLVIACARGYGHFLIDVILDAGREFGIAPAGCERFESWLGLTV
ncbi:MAG: hypothetical protein AB9873_07625 [Syntrophobacteraceae bacterium]